MKKKHWKVSVFDKTSETIRDDTLYTTDTEVYLVFELIDKDFKPDKATVTIYNIYGTATISESVDIVNGIVNYEMPEDAIGHQGGWRTQVVFTKDNEDYTTTVIEFDVDGHLLDNNKPTIVYIENWNHFIKYGERLIDDWEQLEKIRQANERKRERTESVRQKKFETNELIREEAEGNRQSTFEENEVGRQSEFEENEQGRESAESVRVANEAERISKDSERDSKIETVEGIVEDVSVKLDNKVDVSELELYAKKEQEDWVTPTLLNGWAEYVGYPVRYMKDEFGFVHLKGRLFGESINTMVFQLPRGYRPIDWYLHFPLSSNNAFGQAWVNNLGEFTINAGAITNVSLNGITFRVER